MQVAMNGGVTGENDANSEDAPVRLVTASCHLLPHHIVNRLKILTGRDINDAALPTNHIKIPMLHINDGVILYSHQGRPLGPVLADMSPLQVAGEDDPGVFADNLTAMDMTERPVIVTFGKKIIDFARRIGLMTGTPDQ